jgi:hypothetical protein
MRRHVLVLICLVIGSVAQSFEAHLLQGLDVRTEVVADPVRVDGVALTVRRATGTGVAELAQRITKSWQAQRSQLQPIRHGVWRLLSRLQQGRSETVQWRVAGPDSELLWSSVDLVGHVAASPNPSLALPPECRWGRRVHDSIGGHSYLQSTAQCRGNFLKATKDVVTLLRTQGWSVHQTGTDAVSAARATTRVEAYVVKGLQPGDVSFVWLETAPLRGLHR